MLTIYSKIAPFSAKSMKKETRKLIRQSEKSRAN